jgi:hypothetical protein
VTKENHLMVVFLGAFNIDTAKLLSGGEKNRQNSLRRVWMEAQVTCPLLHLIVSHRDRIWNQKSDSEFV